MMPRIWTWETQKACFTAIADMGLGVSGRTLIESCQINENVNHDAVGGFLARRIATWGAVRTRSSQEQGLRSSFTTIESSVKPCLPRHLYHPRSNYRQWTPAKPSHLPSSLHLWKLLSIFSSDRITRCPYLELHYWQSSKDLLRKNTYFQVVCGDSSAVRDDWGQRVQEIGRR